MHSVSLLQKEELGGYKVRVIRSGNRNAIWLSSDALPLFESVGNLWVSWIEGKIGQAVVFSSEHEKWATKTTPIVREQGIIIGIPENYRKWLGLRKGSVISLRYIRLKGKVGFIIEVEC